MYTDPDRQTEKRDQRQFDEAVNRKGKVVLEVLAGVGVLAAVLMSMVALIQSGQKSESTVVMRPHTSGTTGMAMMGSAGSGAAAGTGAAATKTIDLKILPDSKLGPDGKRHDTFTKTNFAVKVGQRVKLRIDNKDPMPHSITAPAAGVNITVTEGVHTYTLVVKHAGKFQWYCMLPCDGDANGWAMQHPGYMSGFITAT